MNQTTNKLWIESPSVIFKSINMLPSSKMELSEQLNSLTRLAIAIFLIMIMINFSAGLYFLVLSIFLLIILCYIQRKRMHT